MGSEVESQAGTQAKPQHTMIVFMVGNTIPKYQKRASCTSNTGVPLHYGTLEDNTSCRRPKCPVPVVLHVSSSPLLEFFTGS